MEAQKERSKKDASKTLGDWQVFIENAQTKFLAYDQESAQIRIARLREVQNKNKSIVQAVFTQTPFYPEGGGQVGDQGYIQGVEDGEKLEVVDTKKENELIVHNLKKVPENIDQEFVAQIHVQKRLASAVMASILLIPAATADSEIILKCSISLVLATCVPPQSSLEKLLSKVIIRTLLPYFSPNKAVAPWSIASWYGISLCSSKSIDCLIF